MEKEVVMEAWLLDEAVEHIHKSIGDPPHSAEPMLLLRHQLQLEV